MVFSRESNSIMATCIIVEVARCRMIDSLILMFVFCRIKSDVTKHATVTDYASCKSVHKSMAHVQTDYQRAIFTVSSNNKALTVMYITQCKYCTQRYNLQ